MSIIVYGVYVEIFGPLVGNSRDVAERRSASLYLGKSVFDEEVGLKTDADLSMRKETLKSWSRFATDILTNAGAPFPSS